MKPAPEADAITLLRRLALDLTGLPPTPEEADAFVLAMQRNPEAVHTSHDRGLLCTEWHCLWPLPCLASA